MKTTMLRHDETCWTVVRGARDGDDQARNLFAETYLDVVRAYLGARWRRNVLQERIDDAVQDVFMDCFKADGALGRVNRDRNVAFRTFLHGVVRNVALRYEERCGNQREKQAASTFEMWDAMAEDERLSRAFDKAWVRGLLSRAAARQATTARQRGETALRRVDLLRLRFGEGLPIREIAERWGEDSARLHHEYAKAREEFKVAMREEIAFQNPLAPPALDWEVEQLLSAFRD